jgi:hypothetical protein
MSNGPYELSLRGEEIPQVRLCGLWVLVQLAGILVRDPIDRLLVKVLKLVGERELGIRP